MLCTVYWNIWIKKKIKFNHTTVLNSLNIYKWISIFEFLLSNIKQITHLTILFLISDFDRTPTFLNILLNIVMKALNCLSSDAKSLFLLKEKKMLTLIFTLELPAMAFIVSSTELRVVAKFLLITYVVIEKNA